MTAMRIVEVFGWLGTVLIFLAYALSSFGVVSAHGLSYQLMNLVGAAGVATVSWKKRAYQPAALNVVWFLIALVALTKVALA